MVDGKRIHPLAGNIGEWVYIQADFTTLNLPSNASYRVGFTVNGLTLDTQLHHLGCRQLGDMSWNLYWGTFIATPGTNQVTATVDPDHSVAETSYADNDHELHLQCRCRRRSATHDLHGGADSQCLRHQQHSQLRLRPGRWFRADDRPRSKPAMSRRSSTDLDGFDQAMSLTTDSTETLYQQYGPASSFVNVYNQSGANITPEYRDQRQ